MDRFVQENKVTPNYLSPVECTNIEPGLYQNPRACFNPAQVMGYYDGNTVTALWNYTQHQTHINTHDKPSILIQNSV
jgi:hypothetical protein